LGGFSQTEFWFVQPCLRAKCTYRDFPQYPDKALPPALSAKKLHPSLDEMFSQNTAFAFAFGERLFENHRSW